MKNPSLKAEKPTAITVKEFYLELTHSFKLKEKQTLIYSKTKKNLANFNMLISRMNGKSIKCLLRKNFIWFKVKLQAITNSIIEIEILKKITLQETVHKMENLVAHIKRFQKHQIEKPKINKYIFHYFKYHFG